MTIPTLINSRAAIPVQADRMSRLEDQIVRLQARIATGERFTEAAEAPAEALRAAALERLTARLDSDQRSIQRATTRLSLAETALESANSILMRATELALAAANGTSSAEDRQIYRAEMLVLRQQMADAANMRDEAGRYIFAGAASTQPAYAPDADGVLRYQGRGAHAGAEAAGIGTAALPAAQSLFGPDGADCFATLDGLVAALADGAEESRTPAINAALSGLSASSDRLAMGRAMVGAGMARLESDEARIEAARMDASEAIADTRGLDLTTAIAQLSALDLTLNAARASFTRIFESTLFDRLG